MASVTQIWIYPIKSCQGIALSAGQLVPGGLRGDRRYMIVDASGAFITARTDTALLSVRTEIIEVPSSEGGATAELAATGAGISSYADAPSYADARIVCTAAGLTPLVIPMHGSAEQLASETRVISCQVWRDSVKAHELPYGSAWFSELLGKSVHLVFQPEHALRQVNLARAQQGDVVSFADGYPLLLTNQASLNDLCERSQVALDMRRFRPNLVISGADAYAEDTWDELQIGGLQFTSPKLCDRCVMTTVDPDSLERSKEPLRTLAQYRKWEGAVWFGTNLIGRSSGMLRVGDEVNVLRERPHPRDMLFEL